MHPLSGLPSRPWGDRAGPLRPHGPGHSSSMGPSHCTHEFAVCMSRSEGLPQCMAHSRQITGPKAYFLYINNLRVNCMYVGMLPYHGKYAAVSHHHKFLCIFLFPLVNLFLLSFSPTAGLSSQHCLLNSYIFFIYSQNCLQYSTPSGFQLVLVFRCKQKQDKHILHLYLETASTPGG